MERMQVLKNEKGERDFPENAELAAQGLSKRIGKNYRIIEAFQHQTHAKLYIGENIETGSRVFIKVMSVSEVPAWKDLELFVKQADILQAIEHPHIPVFQEAFEEDSPEGPQFYLVQNYVENAQSLEDILKEEGKCTLSQSLSIFLQLLDTLDYLHRFVPPIVHRDIKPSNLLLDAHGKLHLIDFDMATATVDENRGSTIAGTIGYMPPEQLVGQAVPASDLYASAMLFLQLLTGRHPSSFPVNDFRVDLSEILPQTLEENRAIIESCLEPDYRSREQKAIHIILKLQDLWNAHGLEIPKHIAERAPLHQQTMALVDVESQRTQRWSKLSADASTKVIDFDYNTPVAPIARAAALIPPQETPRSAIAFNRQNTNETIGEVYREGYVFFGLLVVVGVHLYPLLDAPEKTWTMLTLALYSVLAYVLVVFMLARPKRSWANTVDAHMLALSDILTRWQVGLAQVEHFTLGKVQNIKFSHKVGEVTYTCEQKFRNKVRGAQSPIEPDLLKGDTVAILYNPDNPQQAIVFPGPLQSTVTNFSHFAPGYKDKPRKNKQ